MKYYLATEMNQLLTHVIPWMNFKTIMLSEVYTQEDILYDSIYMKFFDREK